jgi:hypothetical protein
MTTTNTWRSRTAVRATPEHVIVDYTLKPIRAGCALDAIISIHPPRSRLGRLLAPPPDCFSPPAPSITP